MLVEPVDVSVLEMVETNNVHTVFRLGYGWTDHGDCGDVCLDCERVFLAYVVAEQMILIPEAEAVCIGCGCGCGSMFRL